jgi:hypothetical protein
MAPLAVAPSVQLPYFTPFSGEWEEGAHPRLIVAVTLSYDHEFFRPVRLLDMTGMTLYTDGV